MSSSAEHEQYIAAGVSLSLRVVARCGVSKVFKPLSSLAECLSARSARLINYAQEITTQARAGKGLEQR